MEGIMEICYKNTRDISDIVLERIIKNKYVSIDTETTGLDYKKDQLCTIQLYSDDVEVIIQFDKYIEYENLKRLLSNKEIKKIFHNAVFDVSFILKNLEFDNITNIVCTKIASKVLHGLGYNNSLKGLLKEYLNIEIDKSQQLSNWSNNILSEQQINYAMNDVRFLKLLWDELDNELKEKDVYYLAKKSFEYVPTYIKLDSMGIRNVFVY